MRKNLLLRLCLILMVVLTIYSCRTDQFPEKETYNNSSKFRLTSKRISLDEAKHKQQLLSELDNAETKFKAISKTNVNGRVIDYGNGVSIDTDNVIYIENGPNYHTYTFNIKRENAPADAPIENLVLSPLTDGSYRELLFSYHLTPQEKQTFMNGSLVDIKNKFTVTDLEKGTFNNGGELARSQSQSCTLEYEYYYTTCSENMHDHGEQYPTCTAGEPSELVFVIREVCAPSPGGSNGSYNPVDPNFPDGGGGDDSGGGSSTPCNGNGVPTGPQAPASGMGYDSGDGCGSGIPTQPNLPSLATDPCKKAKASITAANNILKNPDVQTQMDAVLKGKVSAPNEFAMKVGDNGNSSYSFSNLVEGNSSQTDLSTAILPSGNYIADGHSHRGGLGTPSGLDLYNLMGLSLTNPHLKYRYVYGTKGGNTEVYALIINDVSLISNFLAQYPKDQNADTTNNSIKDDTKLGKDFYRAVEHYSSGRSENTSGEDYNDNAVAMAYILEKYNTGLSIALVDSNGNLKKINANVQEITVPSSGGAKKEGIKVSKCP